jgi:hypothetical protein
MADPSDRSVLEREARRFFECGWLLKIISGKYYLCNPKTSNILYSREGLEDDSFYTQIDYFNSHDEIRGALRILKFIETNPELIQDYKKIYPGKIVYLD